MIKKVFSVYDEKADYYMKPFLLDEIAEARRTFGDAIADEKTAVSKHPSDYRLYMLGQFDLKLGKMLPIDVNKLVASGTDYKTGVDKKSV